MVSVFLLTVIKIVQIDSEQLTVCVECGRSSIDFGFVTKICPQRKNLKDLSPEISVVTQLDLIYQFIDQESGRPKIVLQAGVT